MADVTKVKASDGVIYTINDADDYTKEEVDTLLAGKADVGDSYTKAEADVLLADKANTSDVESALALKADVGVSYTKAEDDALLADKADVGVSYTKAEEDALLADKADVGDSYTKAEDDALLAGKADVGDSYTKAEDDALLAGKADVGDSYTKAEVDALIGGIKMFPDLDWSNPIFTFSDTQHASFTADRECWLCGCVFPPGGGVNAIIWLNGHKIAQGVNQQNYGIDYNHIPPLKLHADDTVEAYVYNSTTTYADLGSNLHVYVERS